MYAESCLEVDLAEIRGNLQELKKKSHAAVFAVVKANAYGLGANKIGPGLEDLVAGFCVASPAEALNLREKTDLPILLLGYAGDRVRGELIEKKISFAVSTFEEAALINDKAASLNLHAGLHLALDTGHSRIGFKSAYSDDDNFLAKILQEDLIAENEKTGVGSCENAGRDRLFIAKDFKLEDFPLDRKSAYNAESLAQIEKIYQLKNIKVQGLYSHFSRADEDEGRKFSLYQWARFYNFSRLMQEAGLDPGIRHIANDAGLLILPDFMQLDAVRLGICLYGHYPSTYIKENTDLKLRIPYEWTAPIVHVKWIDKGVGVGYGQTWSAPDRRKIATVQIGYADGYDRLLSNRSRVFVQGIPCPLVGRVCMDQIMVDITALEGVKAGDRASLLSPAYDADKMAQELNTISYEILCKIGDRVERKFK